MRQSKYDSIDNGGLIISQNHCILEMVYMLWISFASYCAIPKNITQVRVYDSVLVEELNYKAILISEETTVEDVIRFVSWMLVLSMSMTTMMTMMSMMAMLISGETKVEDVIRLVNMYPI